MIKIFQYYARCNKLINEEIINLIKNSNRNLYNLNINDHFKSINEILFHIYSVDISWIYDLRNIINSKIFSDSIIWDIPIDYKNQFSSIESFEDKRKILDNAIIQLCNDITDNNLKEEISWNNKENKIVTRSIWKILLHLFNHQTHHRGQISEIFDQYNIVNDFSNIIRIEE